MTISRYELRVLIGQHAQTIVSCGFGSHSDVMAAIDRLIVLRAELVELEKTRDKA